MDRMKEEKIIPFEKSLFKVMHQYFDNYWWDLKCFHNKQGGIEVTITVKDTLKKGGVKQC